MESVNSLLRKVIDKMDHLQILVQTDPELKGDHEVRYEVEELYDNLINLQNMIGDRKGRRRSAKIQPLRTHRDYGREDISTLPPIEDEDEERRESAIKIAARSIAEDPERAGEYVEELDMTVSPKDRQMFDSIIGDYMKDYPPHLTISDVVKEMDKEERSALIRDLEELHYTQ